MGPAEAMGTFLKVWRSEWAGLSRAQLAIAVSAHVNGRKAVTSHMVRHWEDGHPPGSTEELDGLCQVMARSGLSRRSLLDFRKSVLATVIDRQYPELLPSDDFTERPDVDEVAHAMYMASETDSHNTVQLVAAFSELRAARTSGPTSARECRQAVAQEAALCYLRALVAGVAFHVNWRVEADLWATNAGVLGSLFGPGGLPGFWPGLDVYRSLAASLHTRACHGRHLASGKRLLEISRSRMAADGHTLAGGPSFLSALAEIARHEPVYPGLRKEAEACWEAIRSSMWPDGVDHCRAALIRVTVRQGLLSEAEEHLVGLESWRDGGGWPACVWYDRAGEVELSAGRFRQAEELFAAGLDAAERHDDPYHQRWFARMMLDCERRKRSARNRPALPDA